jgi:glycerophosphoryl diester phosphodiesterase
MFHYPVIKNFMIGVGFFANILSFVSCQRNKEVPIPDTQWPLFDSASATSLPSGQRSQLEGVYRLGDGAEKFGETAAAKWSYTITREDTIHQLSFFCEKDISYFILQGKELGGQILLNGFWRKMEGGETGRVRLSMKHDDRDSTGKTLLTGTWGLDSEEPENPLQLSIERPLYKGKPLEIIGHRGGGRTTDFIPASENSLELIRMSASFGSTGVELDVQITRDGIPILYHDSRINDRLTQKGGVRGNLEEYSYADLKDTKLKKGEHIPTLREALETILYQTPLQFIWMDCKDKKALAAIRALQQEFMEKANEAGRTIEMVIGLPDEEIIEHFRLLPDHLNIPSLCELDTSVARTINSRIWAGLWAEGLQEEEVSVVHRQGRKAFVWTVDKAEKVKEFMLEGDYDGIVSNFPSQLAWYYYTRK